ncbi:MAG: RNA polymerase sigma factor [Aeoliella sp.]
MQDPNDHNLAAQVEDRALAARCLTGDQRAMRELVERYEGVVLRVCLRMLRHRQDAEDIVQETFVRAIRSLGRWDPERRFQPWLLAIAANRCRTALGRRRVAPFDHQEMADELPARRDHRPAMRQLSEEVDLALAEIRDEYRQAFELFHKEELAYAEIAEVLEVPLGTVKTWVHRARQEVAVQLRRRGVVETVCESEVNHAMPTHRNTTARVAG